MIFIEINQKTFNILSNLAFNTYNIIFAYRLFKA